MAKRLPVKAGSARVAERPLAARGSLVLMPGFVPGVTGAGAILEEVANLMTEGGLNLMTEGGEYLLLG